MRESKMYMDILEQEVEALSAEVTRLRLMVHRVTQVMEAPPPHRHSHVDPLSNAPSSSSTSDGGPRNLQATVDSYKQIIPLIQLLLEQQQQWQQSTKGSSTRHHSSGSRSKKKKTLLSGDRHRHRRYRHSRRSPSPSTAYSTFDCASQTSSSTSPSRTNSSSSSIARSSHKARSDAVKEKAEDGPPSASTSVVRLTAASVPEACQPTAHVSDRRYRLSVESTEETPARMEQHSFPPSSTPKSNSLVDCLRAQRRLTSRIDENDNSSSPTDSSDDMPMFRSQPQSAAMSLPNSAQRQFPADPRTFKSTPTATAPMQPNSSDMVLNTKMRAHMSHSLLSSKLLDAPLATEVLSGMAKRPIDSVRSVSMPAEDMDYYDFTPVLSVFEAHHTASDAPAEAHYHSEAQKDIKPSSAHRGRSTADSLEYSEQGRYNYSAFGSPTNSPALSHVPEDAVAKSALTCTTTATSAALEVTPHTTRSSKQLPQQTSVMSPAREISSNTSSGGDSSSSGDANVARMPTVLTTSSTTRPFGSGIVLGARQPISAHVPSSNALHSAIPMMGRIDPTAVRVGGSSISAAAAGAAGAADARTNLMATLRSMKSGDRSNSSSSSSGTAAAAVFQRQQARHAVKEDYRESSFHNYSEAANSPHGSSINTSLQKQNNNKQQQKQQCQTPSQSSPRQQDLSTKVSQDAYSLAAYSTQRSAQGSPQGRDINEASAEFSRVLSQSVSGAGAQMARSDSHGVASSAGRRGSLVSGGYYYGYDLGTGSPSQHSVVSNAGMEHRTASSSLGYDY